MCRARDGRTIPYFLRIEKEKGIAIEKNVLSEDAIGKKRRTVEIANPLQEYSISNSAKNATGFVQNSDRDSEGRSLTKGQQEYFKDSKVRDDKGRLIPLYHQTDSIFTVFDVKKQGAGVRDNETPFGIFLKSSDKDIGLNGKKQMKLYANITNPLYANNRSELKKQLVSLSPLYAELIKKHQNLDSLYKEKFERAKKELIEYMASWRKQS